MKELLTFYLSSKGTVSRRAYVLAVVLPQTLFLLVLLAAILLRVSPAPVVWCGVLLSVPGNLLGRPLATKRLRAVGKSPARIRRSDHRMMLAAGAAFVSYFAIYFAGYLALIPLAAAGIYMLGRLMADFAMMLMPDHAGQ